MISAATDIALDQNPHKGRNEGTQSLLLSKVLSSYLKENPPPSLEAPRKTFPHIAQLKRRLGYQVSSKE